MSETVRVVVDAMGGDNAPQELVKGAVQAVNGKDNIRVILTGRAEAIQRELAACTYPADRIEVVNCSQVIGTAEPPVAAIRSKKDSSLVTGLQLVRKGEADAIVSAGNSGAVLVGGQAIVGRIRGIERPALAVLIPTLKGVSLLIDCGANVDARAEHLVKFARMGSVYMERVAGVKNPRVGLVNIGAEEEKGNALVKETYPLLKECRDLSFAGNVEARDIPAGVCDVVVCEAFVGNVILKLYEGLSKTLMKKMKESLMSTTRSKIGALLVKPALKDMLRSFDATEYGGAPMLGLKGLVVKTHGSAKAKEVEHSIYQCEQFLRQDISGIIRREIAGEQAEA